MRARDGDNLWSPGMCQNHLNGLETTMDEPWSMSVCVCACVWRVGVRGQGKYIMSIMSENFHKDITMCVCVFLGFDKSTTHTRTHTHTRALLTFEFSLCCFQ